MLLLQSITMSMPSEFAHEIPGAVGPLEALLNRPSGPPRAAVVFAHPHPLQGGTMRTKVVFHASKALARIGCVVLRFNFRGVGLSAGTFDAGLGEMDDYRAALNYMADRFPGLPLWAGGLSFGSWIALSVGAADPRVAALIGIAPPVDRYDYSALETSTIPKFFVHGELDELVSIKEVRKFYARLPEPKELIEIDSATHLFDGQASEVGDALEGLLADFAVAGSSS